MKCFLLLLFCAPIFVMGQSSGRQDDTLRQMADTAHYPQPFIFSATGTSKFSKKALYEKCHEWLSSVKDSLPAIQLTREPTYKKLVASNVPATASISCSVVITITGNKYVCTLRNYLFHGINGKSMPVEQAAQLKSSGQTINVERLIILKHHQQIFDALRKYVNR